MNEKGLTAGIEVTAEYSPIAFGLAIVRPQLQLDAYDPVPWQWATGVLPVSPGPHRVRCWFRWGLFAHGGDSTLDVDVPEGALVRLSYKAPTWFVFLRGRWAHQGTTALPAPGSGWHPDPTGRHALRYWDGSAWTAHVSTNGVASSDPMA